MKLQKWTQSTQLGGFFVLLITSEELQESIYAGFTTLGSVVVTIQFF